MKEDILSSVQKMYDEAGSLWNQTRSKKYRVSGTQNWPVTQKCLDTLSKGQSVLDVGCGNGRLVSGIPEGITYLGIDFSQTLLSEAEKQYPGRKFVFGNIVEDKVWEKLPQYDALFCIAVLHHIPERKQQVSVLRKMHEHTKKGGFLFLTVWNLWQEKYLQFHLDSLELKKQNERWVEIPFAKNSSSSQTGWKRFCVQMDIPYLVEIMTEAGWDVQSIYFADRDGNESSIVEGQNLVARAAK